MEKLSLAPTLKPKYWNGHSIKDECEWSSPFYPEPFFLLDREAEGFARQRFRDFFDYPLRFPVRRFDDEQIFDASKFPQGTIVRFEEELFTKSSGPMEIVGHKGAILELPTRPGYLGFESHIHWGVVALHNHLGKATPGLVHAVHQLFDESGPVHTAGPLLLYLEYSPLKIGDVYHYRALAKSSTTKKVKRYETLERIKWLEVIEASDEGTRKVSPLFEALRSLVPQALKPDYSR